LTQKLKDAILYETDTGTDTGTDNGNDTGEQASEAIRSTQETGDHQNGCE